MRRIPVILMAMAFPVPGTISAFVATGFVPVVQHPERTAAYTRFGRFPRKTKPTFGEAIAYAERVIWHRKRRAAEKRRHIEGLQHLRYDGRAA